MVRFRFERATSVRSGEHTGFWSRCHRSSPPLIPTFVHRDKEGGEGGGSTKSSLPPRPNEVASGRCAFSPDGIALTKRRKTVYTDDASARMSDVASLLAENENGVGTWGCTGVPQPYIKGDGGTSRLNGSSVREGSYVDVSGWQQRQTSQ